MASGYMHRDVRDSGISVQGLEWTKINMEHEIEGSGFRVV